MRPRILETIIDSRRVRIQQNDQGAQWAVMVQGCVSGNYARTESQAREIGHTFAHYVSRTNCACTEAPVWTEITANAAAG